MTDDASIGSGVPPSGDDGSSRFVNALPPGTRLFEFELLRVLGEGGFGVVYLAFDHALHRNVAIKEYLPNAFAVRRNDRTIVPRSVQHQATFDAGLKSFIKEARLLAQFDHPALVKVHRFWEEHGTGYMVMSYYPGQTLADLLRADPALATEARLRRLIAPLLDAVTQLHEQQCFHRDISPENIIVQPNGAPVLLDFGAARRIIGDMTQALTVVLKPGYAPIEQYVEDGGLTQGPWTDVYGFAALLYRAITGKPPPAAVTRAFKDPVKPLADNPPPGFSERFLRGIDAGLAVKPDERPVSLDAFREALGLAESSDGQQTVIIPRSPVSADLPGPRSVSGPLLSAPRLEPAPGLTPSLEKNTVAAGSSPRPATLPPVSGAPAAPEGKPRARPATSPSRSGWLWGASAVLAIGAGVTGAWFLGLFDTAPTVDRVRAPVVARSNVPEPPPPARKENAPGPVAGTVSAAASSHAEATRPGSDTPPSPADPMQAPAPARIEPAPAPAQVDNPTSARRDDSPAPTAAAVREGRSPPEPAPPSAPKDKGPNSKVSASPPTTPSRDAPRSPPSAERNKSAVPATANRPVPDHERPRTAPEIPATVAQEPPPRVAKVEVDRGTESSLPRDLSDEGRRLYLGASAGSAQAQTALANLYFSGRGAPQSDAEAVRWWTKAAEQGNANAQNNLGFMYYAGRGAAKDQAEAARWWLKAAEQGFAAAQNNLGRAYLNGFGVAKNEQEAARWYRRAAEQGHAGSQKQLGDMYFHGVGVQKAEAEAVAWYRRAADNGNVQAADQLKAIESMQAK